MNLIQGNVIGTGMKVAIVASRFNEFIVNKLLAGAEDGLVRHGVAGEDIDAYWVPGAFELPLLGQKLAQSGRYDAVICVGAVIRGATSHYDLVCSETAKGIAQAAMHTRRFQGRQQRLRLRPQRQRNGGSAAQGIRRRSTQKKPGEAEKASPGVVFVKVSAVKCKFIFA